MLDVCREDTYQDSALAPIVARPQGVADLADRGSRLVHAARVDRLSDANRAMAAVSVAEAVEQIFMAMELGRIRNSNGAGPTIRDVAARPYRRRAAGPLYRAGSSVTALR